MSLTKSARVTQGVVQEIGEVEKSAGAGVVVSTPHGILRARLAFSCLVKPVCGDVVLISRRDQESFVLAILERRSDSPVELNINRSLALQVDGDLTLQAGGHAELAAGTEARLHADAVAISGDQIQLTGNRVSLIGKAFHWLGDSLDSTLRMIRQIADVYSLKARSHQRQIDDLELVRVGHLDLRAEQILNLHAEHTIVKSRELVKLDGKQIQVG